MKRTKTLVYVGPSAPVEAVHGLLPSATVLPPAAVGDILRAAHDRRVKRIALIDGYFERMAAVWHKEILVALECGIEVWGAASMGALRAAELYAFGMRGYGHVFKAYKRGHVVADDEVAVAHLPAEYGYRAVSEALINIRFNVHLATGKVLTAATAERLLALAQARFYRERTWSTLFADARAAKLPRTELARFERQPKMDFKVWDALGLLTRLRRASVKQRRAHRVPRTWALRQLERLVL